MLALGSALSDWSTFAAAVASAVAAGVALVTTVLLRQQWRDDKCERDAFEHRQAVAMLNDLRIDCVILQESWENGKLVVQSVPAWTRSRLDIVSLYPLVADKMARLEHEIARVNIVVTMLLDAAPTFLYRFTTEKAAQRDLDAVQARMRESLPTVREAMTAIDAALDGARL